MPVGAGASVGWSGRALGCVWRPILRGGSGPQPARLRPQAFASLDNPIGAPVLPSGLPDRVDQSTVPLG